MLESSEIIFLGFSVVFANSDGGDGGCTAGFSPLISIGEASAICVSLTMLFSFIGSIF